MVLKIFFSHPRTLSSNAHEMSLSIVSGKTFFKENRKLLEFGPCSLAAEEWPLGLNALC